MLRKITSLTSFFSFIVLISTSLVLYIVPQGRVAYWADWTLFGLSKEQWGDIHICTGVLFLVISIMHIWLNWKPILAYLKKKAGEANFTSPAFFISLGITLFVAFGTLANLPPMKQVLELTQDFQAMGEAKYGTPPYGHAELSPLQIFCKRMGLDVDKASASIKNAGIELESPRETIKSIANKAGLTPKEIHEIILKDQPQKDSSVTDKSVEFNQHSGQSGSGIGRMNLEQYCTRFNLDLNTALGILREQGVVVDKATPIKEIAGALGLDSPRAIADLLNP
ncbi:DUF4405 domain-containing protein [Maridesulfovibrio sp.]|uniref:DUF4405 domain-containing protein n=1 Tax=Maridesulfovibrio sp. TaxID=2795000 RepID=UPI0029CAA6AA|nr:DUF4405 domain-containing protein [Maridesulfovibrio sp.]